MHIFALWLKYRQLRLDWMLTETDFFSRRGVFDPGWRGWGLISKSFTEHFCHDEDEDGSKKTAAAEEINQGVTGRT